VNQLFPRQTCFVSHPPRVAMQILRHSDIRLTMINYTDETLLATAEAIRKVPSFG
jgi:hypothetical protein